MSHSAIREAIPGEKWCFFEHCSNGGGGQPMFKNFVGNCRSFWMSFNNMKFAWKGTFEAWMVKFGGKIGTLYQMLKNAFKKHPLQNRTNVQIKGGGSKAFWTMFKKTALFWNEGFPYRNWVSFLSMEITWKSTHRCARLICTSCITRIICITWIAWNTCIECITCISCITLLVSLVSLLSLV